MPPAAYTESPGPLTPRNSLGAAFGSDGRAYVVGGTFDGGAPMDLVEELNPDSGLVTVGPAMRSPRAAFALVASPDGHMLYAIGGDTPPTPSAESFDVATQTWSPLPALPAPGGLALGGVLADGRVVVLLPGVPGRDGGASVEILDDGGWSEGPEFFPAVSWSTGVLAAACLNATFYVVDEELTVQAWDTSADGGAWHAIATTSALDGHVVTGFSMAEAAGHLFVTGGLFDGVDCKMPFFSSFALDLANPDGGWSAGPSAPVNRDLAALAVSAGQQMFLVGGEESSSCCTGHSEELSENYPGSYDIFDLDAGTWELTHSR